MRTPAIRSALKISRGTGTRSKDGDRICQSRFRLERSQRTGQGRKDFQTALKLQANYGEAHLGLAFADLQLAPAQAGSHATGRGAENARQIARLAPGPS